MIDEEMCFPMMPLFEVKAIKFISNVAKEISLGRVSMNIEIINHSLKVNI